MSEPAMAMAAAAANVPALAPAIAPAKPPKLPPSVSELLRSTGILAEVTQDSPGGYYHGERYFRFLAESGVVGSFGPTFGLPLGDKFRVWIKPVAER